MAVTYWDNTQDHTLRGIRTETKTGQLDGGCRDAAAGQDAGAARLPAHHLANR
jgi:hypothetical protein